MLQDLSREQRLKTLPIVYSVGVGYWPSVESFVLGNITSALMANVHSEGVLANEEQQLRQQAHADWICIYFVVTGAGKEQVTEADAMWFLRNMDSY